MSIPAIVSGTLQTLTSGKIVQGQIIFQLTNVGTGNPIGISGTSIIPNLKYVATTAQDGTFTLPLWGNDSITPSNTLYSVTFRDFLGNEMGPILYSIVGVTVNLNSLAATGSVSPPVITPNAVVTNPSAAQVITGFGLTVPSLTLTAVAPTVAAGQVGIGSTTASTVGAAGAATALPAQPLGYLIVNVAGVQVKIPYYNN